MNIGQHALEQLSTTWQTLRDQIPGHVTILPAVKYGDALQAAAFVNAGAHGIGENRVQDAADRKKKMGQMGLPAYETHMIGTLQRNKVKKSIELFDCIQSLDRRSVIETLSMSCAPNNTPISGMLQLNIGDEPNKSGFSATDIRSHLPELCAFPNVTIIGIMVVAPQIEHRAGLRALFREARRVFDDAQRYSPLIRTLSMGMSHDYQLAIDEGSTMVRIGSILYGLK